MATTPCCPPIANAALSPDDLPKDLFSPGTHLHMSGYTLLNEGSRPAALAAFELASRAGMTVLVDGASAAPLERIGAEPFLDLTNGVTLPWSTRARPRCSPAGTIPSGPPGC